MTATRATQSDGGGDGVIDNVEDERAFSRMSFPSPPFTKISTTILSNLELDPLTDTRNFWPPTANLVTKLGALAVLSIKVEAEAPQGWGELSQLRKAVSNFELSVACIMQMRVMKRDKADWY